MPGLVAGAERARVLAVLRHDDFVDKHGEVRERRAQATHPAKVKPELVTTAPGQVWSWDITKLQGPGPPTAKALRERHARLADSSHLPHRLGTNQFFIDLHVHARHSGGTAQLLRWWSDRETAERYLRRVHPDGHALWRENSTTMGLFLEYDSGSEHLDRLVRKLDAYDQLAYDGGPAYPVLFWLHSTDRERHLHEHLAARRGGPVPVATAVRDTNINPADAVWALADDPHPRRRPIGPPFHHGRPDSPYAPDHRGYYLELDE